MPRANQARTRCYRASSRQRRTRSQRPPPLRQRHHRPRNSHWSLALANDQRPQTNDVPMIHEILPVGPLQCNCSVVGDETTREAMVIDPGDDVEDVLALIRKHNLQVKQIVITHANINHVDGAMKLNAVTGVPILINMNDYEY